MTTSKKAPLINDTQVRHLADLLNETGLSELEIEVEGTRLRLKRDVSPAPIQATVPTVATPAPSIQETKPSLENALKAPLVGTFYHAASPEAAPFVKIGDKVKSGQVVGIIEAMKTMNNVEADRSGTISQILTDDAAPVEFGQALMIIE